MNNINTRISEIGVVPVIKLTNPERDAAPLAKALCAGGLPIAEVTFRAAGADKAIRLMKEACPEILVGAGTVLTTEHIDKAIAAGAEFIVTPGFDPELCAYCAEKGIAISPDAQHLQITTLLLNSALKFSNSSRQSSPAVLLRSKR